MNKGIIFCLLILLITPIVLAASNDSSVPFSQDVSSIVIQQSLQTRNELKTYFDKSFNKWLTDATSKAQVFLDENIGQLDAMIRAEIAKYYIKVLIGLVAGIFLAGMLIYFVIMSVRKLMSLKLISERKVILDWLEAHEKEQSTIREFDKEMREMITFFKEVKAQAQANKEQEVKSVGDGKQG